MWEHGKETSYSMFNLDPSCTVFQSEMFALHKALEMVKKNEWPTVNIMSDSRSSLDLLNNPKVTHPLANSIKNCMRELMEEKRRVRLFWLRAHVGTAGNERADELAKSAALRSVTKADYEKIPLSYVKRKIREESVRKWQDRYDTSTTGSVTKTFFPDVNEAFRIVRTMKLTQIQVQALTGHGGMAEYLHRFKLKDSPGCECDPDVVESVWYIIIDCPRFVTARHELQSRMNILCLSKSEIQCFS